MAAAENLFAAIVRQGKTRGKALAAAAPGARGSSSAKNWGLGPNNVLPLPPNEHPKAAAFAKHVVMRAPKTKPDLANGVTQRAIDDQHARARGILGLQGRQEQALRIAAKPSRESTVTTLTPLREVTVHAGAADTTGPNATVIIIRAGIGNPEDRHFYTPAALQESVDNKLWEGVQCYIDHPTTVEDKIIPERRVEMLAGYFQDAKMATDLGRPAIAATFVPEIGNGVVLDKLRTAVAYAKKFPDKSYVGWSINALGVGAPDKVNGQTVNRVDHLTKATSVDLVTKAGAGGRLLTFREAYRMSVAAAKKPFSDEQVTALGEIVSNVVKLELREAVKTAVEESKKAQRNEADGEMHLPTCDCETKTHGDDIASCDCLKGCPAMLEEDEDGMESLGEADGGGTDAGAEGSREAGDERDGDRAHRRRNREAREARRARKESKHRVPASRGHATGSQMTDDDAVRSVDPAPDTDDEDATQESAVLEVAVESLTRQQLEAFAKKQFAEAKKSKREAAKARESSRSSVRLVTQMKREAAAELVLRESGIPTAHHPRLMRELTRDAETVGEMRTIAKEYKKAYVEPFAIGAGGGVLRESGGVPSTLKLKCFAGGLK